MRFVLSPTSLVECSLENHRILSLLFEDDVVPLDRGGVPDMFYKEMAPEKTQDLLEGLCLPARLCERSLGIPA